jgi:hypothetical protein
MSVNIRYTMEGALAYLPQFFQRKSGIEGWSQIHQSLFRELLEFLILTLVSHTRMVESKEAV